MTSEVKVHRPVPMLVAARACACSFLTLVGAMPQAGCPKVFAEKDAPLNSTCAFLFILEYPLMVLSLFSVVLNLLTERAHGLCLPAVNEIPRSLAPFLPGNLK